MRYLLALGLLLGFQDADVPALIQKLADEKLEVRDQASRDLEKLGEKAVEPLRKAHAEAADPELKARVADLLMKIDVEFRRKNFKGDKVVAGLCARLEADVTEVKVGGDLNLALQIMNLEAKDIQFLMPANTVRRIPGLLMTGPTNDLIFDVRMTKGKPPENHAGGIGCGPEPRRAGKILKPGQSYTASFFLQTAVGGFRQLKLEPGEYEATVTYAAKSQGLIEGALEDLITNVVKFKVTE